MPTLSPFTPQASITVSATATTKATALPSGGGNVLRLANVTAFEAFVVLGSSAAAATSTGTSMSLPANSIAWLSVDNSTQTHLALKRAGASTGTNVILRVTRGDGSGI